MGGWSRRVKENGPKKVDVPDGQGYETRKFGEDYFGWVGRRLEIKNEEEGRRRQ